MSKLSKCIHGGGSACERQGGDGSRHHTSSYTHPFPSAGELPEPVGDPVRPVKKSRTTKLNGLEEFFDEDLSKSVLSLPFDQLIDVNNLAKSLYDFDLESEDGIDKLMQMLPIMDPEILVDLMEEIWPGYQAEDLSPELMRAEIKGYLMDYLKDEAS